MPRAIRNAANSVASAGEEVDNAATWASIVLSKINAIIDAVKKDKHLELEITYLHIYILLDV